MDCKLEPLSWKDFDRMYRKAWNNGWVFGPAFTELYLDYLENWNLFMNYLEEVIENSDAKKSIKILIGEAPPIWNGTNLFEERTYFYNEKHKGTSQSWLIEPSKYFYQIQNSSSDWKIKFEKELKSKKQKLTFLAQQGVILIDVFPFPIIQDTENRKRVYKKKKQTSFSEHVNEYLIEHLKKLIVYLKFRTNNNQLAFECAFMAPEYTSLQLMYDPHIIGPFKNLNLEPLKNFKIKEISQITFDKSLKKGELLLTRMTKSGKPKSVPKSKFLENLTKNKIITENDLEKIPILISDRTPKFVNFFNSTEDSIKKKF